MASHLSQNGYGYIVYPYGLIATQEIEITFTYEYVRTYAFSLPGVCVRCNKAPCQRHPSRVALRCRGQELGVISKAIGDQVGTLSLGKGGQRFAMAAAPSSPENDLVHAFLGACSSHPLKRMTATSSTVTFSDVLEFGTAASASLVSIAKELPQLPFTGLLACENYNHQFVIRPWIRTHDAHVRCTHAHPWSTSACQITLRRT